MRLKHLCVTNLLKLARANPGVIYGARPVTMTVPRRPRGRCVYKRLLSINAAEAYRLKTAQPQ